MVTPLTVAKITEAPGRLPWLGHGLPLLRKPLELFSSLHSRGDIVELRLGRVKAFVLTHPSLIDQLLRESHGALVKGLGYSETGALLGSGLIAVDGPYHRQQRGLLNPLFTRPATEHHIPVFASVATEATNAWQPGQVLDFNSEMKRVATMAMTRSLCSLSLTRPEMDDLHKALPVIFKGTVRIGAFPWLLKLPLPSTRRYLAAIRKVRDTVNSHVTTRKRDDDEHHDMLSHLLGLRNADGGETLTAEQILDEVVTAVVAGTESPGGALAWVFHHLAHDARAEQQVIDEVDAVVGDQPVSASHLPRLVYTQRVMTEVLRMYSPWVFTRRSTCPVTFQGIDFPADTEFIFSPYGVHHDARFHHEPFVFDPDRWLPDRAKDLPHGAYIPFSTGHYRCIGGSITLTHAIVTIATVISRWQLRHLDDVPVRMVASGAVHPHRLLMVAHPRAGRLTGQQLDGSAGKDTHGTDSHVIQGGARADSRHESS